MFLFIMLIVRIVSSEKHFQIHMLGSGEQREISKEDLLRKNIILITGQNRRMVL